MDAKAKKVDELFATWDKQDSPGCAVAVMKNNKLIYKQGYGYANLEYDIPITPATIFHVASVSKQFTAMAILLLADEGKISLDDDVRKHVSEVPAFGETITIRHLIHHTSGLRDQWQLLILAEWRLDDVITTEDVLELVGLQQELCFKPGDEYLYCNTGYTLMAVIIERVSGMTFTQFCTERIFDPLKMHSTHFHEDHTKIVKNRAYSYAPKEEGFKHSVLSYAIAGATSLFTTVEDLALWEQNFYDAKVGGAAVIKQMHQRGTLNNGEQIDYAFGLAVGDYKGLKMISHSGGDAGYRSNLTRIPEQHFSVAFLGNLSTLNPSALARKVVDVYLAEEFEVDSEKSIDSLPVIELSPNQLSNKTGFYYSAEKAKTHRLEIRDSKLIGVIGPGFELEPLSEELFQVAAFPQVKFRFETTENGVQRFNILGGDRKPNIYEKVDTVNPSIEEMKDYVGAYYSPELNVRYSVLLKNDKLMLKRRKYGECPLLPTFRDGFISDFMPGEGAEGDLNTKFVRDEKDHVCGFRLSTDRVRNLLFLKK